MHGLSQEKGAIRTIIKVHVDQPQLSELLLKVLCRIIEHDIASQLFELLDL